MKKRTIRSSIRKRMNVERFTDLRNEVDAFEARIADPLLKKVFHKKSYLMLLEKVLPI